MPNNFKKLKIRQIIFLLDIIDYGNLRIMNLMKKTIPGSTKMKLEKRTRPFKNHQNHYQILIYKLRHQQLQNTEHHSINEIGSIIKSYK